MSSSPSSTNRSPRCSARSTPRCKRRSRSEQRPGRGRTDDVDRGPVADQLLRVRRVTPPEAGDICASLAKVHQDALRSGMALGALDSMGRGVLERSYRDVVAALDDRDRVLLVAEDDEEILAMAQLVFGGATNADHRAEVQRIGVAANARGRGIGRRLMVAVEETARQSGVTLLWLTTHDGTDACVFYEAIGYTRMGTMPNYSRRPDGTLWPGAFYFKELSA